MQKIAPNILYEMSLNKDKYTDIWFVLRDLENGLILPSRYESYRKMVEDEGSNFFSKK